MARMLLFLVGFALYSVPVTASLSPLILIHSNVGRLAAALIVVPIFILSFPVWAGILSIPFWGFIKKGKFQRSFSDRTYAGRRFYGICWNSVYYLTPIYMLWLNSDFLKGALFRLFGYGGHLQFAVQPDTWIRDLPLLEMGKGSYVANKATVGTNICLANGFILVDRVRLDQEAMVGHLTMVAPGVRMAANSELGVGVGFGIRASIGEGSKVGGCCAINHGADIGKNCSIGTMSYVGIRAKLGDGINLPGGANIPSGAVLLSREDVEKYLSSETVSLNQLRRELAANFESRLHLTKREEAMHEVEDPAV